MANDNGKKGFSALSDLASEVSGTNEPIKSESKTKAKPSTHEQPPQPQWDTTTSEPEQKSTSSTPPVETINTGNNEGGYSSTWVLGIISVVFVIWLVNYAGQSNNKPSYTQPSSSQSYGSPKSTPAPVAQTQSTIQSSGLEYRKPSVGSNNVLSVPEIRWCIREGIRIEAMRDIIDNNTSIDEFNQIVNDYNSRCGSYRYREGSQSRAERDVEAYRSQIVSEAIREARQLGRSYQPSYPSVSPGVSNNTAPKKPNTQYTREAQQILTDLGYDPGPVDGDYGRRTTDAVKAFQRDAGITQDGWIDQDLLSVLRRVTSQRSSSPPRVESRPAQETKKQQSPPENSWVQGDQWYCNSGFKRVGDKCVSINPPENSWVQGDQWYCNSGFKRVGDKCVSINRPANSWVQGDKWYCNSGFKKVDNRCVSINPPENSWVQGDQWYCNSGFKRVGDKCVSINPPENSWVQGDQWYCNSGFKRVGDKCVSINRPANSWVQGDQWYCNSGFKRVGDKCVSIFGQ